MKNRVLQSTLFVIVCVALGAGVGVYTSKYYQTSASAKPEIPGLMWPNPKALTSFSMMTQNSTPFGLEQLQGKWSFLFFGFTHCPDICPITLTVMKEAYMKLLGRNAAADVQMIFVSVDPKRDTPEQLKEYVKFFHPDFIGLTGSDEQVNSLAGQIGVIHAIGAETAPGEYPVDHSASVFLVSPAGQLLALFSAPQQTDDMLARYSSIRTFIEQQ